MISKDSKTGRIVIDREAGRALERLAKVNPEAAAVTASLIAKRSGVFAHLDTPATEASLRAWQAMKEDGGLVTLLRESKAYRAAHPATRRR